MRGLLRPLAAALLAATSARGVSLFGFYSADLSATAAFSNLFQADSVADVQSAHAAGQRVLLLTYDAFFTSVPSRMVLRPDYEARWAALAAQAAPLLADGSLYGFNLGDELIWNCLDPANLTVAADAVRASFATAVIWYNEATPPLQSGIDSCGHTGLNVTVPSSLDIFSTDLYHMDGEVDGWVEAHVRPFYEAYIYPRLRPGQQVMLVPGSFGSNVNHFPNGTYVCDKNCYDEMCAADALDFLAWAKADAKVLAIMPWNWAGCPPCNGSRWTPPDTCCMDELGTDVMPLARAAWAAVGREIIGGGGNGACSSAASADAKRAVQGASAVWRWQGRWRQGGVVAAPAAGRCAALRRWMGARREARTSNRMRRSRRSGTCVNTAPPRRV